MYDNIGGKIKGLAKTLSILGAIAIAILAIILLCSNDKLIPFGVLLLIFGPLFAWISSWILYGFGELVENSSIISGKLASEKASKKSEDPVWDKGKIFCELCGTEVEESTYITIKNNYGTFYRHICKNCYESTKQ